MITIDDECQGSVFLYFLTDFDARQALSIINYVLENPNVNIDSISPLVDDIAPVIHFNSTAGVSGEFISLNGATSGVPYNTSDGFTFSTSISLGTFGTAGSIDKDKLKSLLINFIDDNRDGQMDLQNSQLLITGTANSPVEVINGSGTYSLKFNFEDLAQNNLSNVIVNINITT